MLRKVNGYEVNIEPKKIKDCAFPSPFEAGLEFSSPARGTWNIAHQGMLIPQAHEIFVCAASCLRGVVLTAYEMKAERRFSSLLGLLHQPFCRPACTTCKTIRTSSCGSRSIKHLSHQS